MKELLITFLVGAVALGFMLIIYILLLEFVLLHSLGFILVVSFIVASFLVGRIILKMLKGIEQKDNQ